MTQVKHGDKMFYVGDSADKPDAMMTYVPTGEDKIIIDHTEVSDELRGQGVGEAMVKAAVEYARENNKKIIPICPFAKHVIDENKDYQDVVTAE